MRLSPALLVIEDIDSLPNSCRSTFLNKLDGTTKNEGIFLIGTTNYPEKIDPALMNRAGRFDRTYEIKDPDEETKYNYLIKKGLKEFVSDEKEIRSVLAHMKNFSMAALNEFFTSAALEFHYNNKVDLLKLVKTLNELGEKQIKNNWHEKEKSKIGFY
ncbi:putative ATPase YjoB [compost metagenome]